MPVEAIRRKTPAQIRAAVDGFASRYVRDWDDWLAAGTNVRPELFGRILRKWQAARPGAVRRLRREARHGAPFLDELLAEAEEPLHLMANLSVATVSERTPAQDEALAGLWSIFSRLRISGVTSCVGITKAILLLTDGKIGPAFDSRVRANLGVARPSTCSEWLQALENIAEDIAMFERANGSLRDAVPPRFASLAYGRLYDMALGPR